MRYCVVFLFWIFLDWLFTNTFMFHMLGRTEVRWRPGQAEPELFQKQIYCIEEITCDVVGTFRRPPQWIGARSIVPPLPPSLRPCSHDNKRCFHVSYRPLIIKLIIIPQQLIKLSLARCPMQNVLYYPSQKQYYKKIAFHEQNNSFR